MTDPRCEQLDEYLCGWLPPDEVARFEAHLADCPACREERLLQQQIDRLLAEGTAHVEPAPVALVRRVDRKVQAARRRRLLGWAGAAAAAGIIVAVSLWAVQSMFLARGDGREVARIARNEVAIPEKSTQSGNFPPLQQGGVRPELVATPELPEPPLVAAARVTMIDPTSAIVVPVESHSPNVTLVCIYPTMRAAREEDRPSP